MGACLSAKRDPAPQAPSSQRESQMTVGVNATTRSLKDSDFHFKVSMDQDPWGQKRVSKPVSPLEIHHVKQADQLPLETFLDNARPAGLISDQVGLCRAQADFVAGEIKGLLLAAIGLSQSHGGYISVITPDCTAFVLRAKSSINFDTFAREAAPDSWAFLLPSPSDPLVVSDATTDERFRHCPLVHPKTDDGFAARFLALVPLVVKGCRVGHLGLLGKTPRTLQDHEVAALKSFSFSITALLQTQAPRLSITPVSNVNSTVNLQDANLGISTAITGPRNVGGSVTNLTTDPSQNSGSNPSAQPNTGTVAGSGAPVKYGRINSIHRLSATGLSNQTNSKSFFQSTNLGRNTNGAAHRTSFSLPRRRSLEAQVTVPGSTMTSAITISDPTTEYLQDLLESKTDLFSDLKLGNLIGRGGFGRVYSADWRGTLVAVKIIEHRMPKVFNADESHDQDELTENFRARLGPLFEALLSTNVSHPNLVMAYKHSTRLAPEPEDLDYCPLYVDLANHLWETWLVLEFCDQGPLRALIDRKAFCRGGTPALQHVLLCLKDVIAGLLYLESRNLSHGDLTCNNVLCVSSGRDVRRFICKVSDFGLSRVNDGATKEGMKIFGTPSHMPSECFGKNNSAELTNKVDVYSFGVIMVELLSGVKPWDGAGLSRVVNDKTTGKDVDYLLSFIQKAPREYVELTRRCLSRNPDDRPTFMEILSILEAMLDPKKLNQLMTGFTECLMKSQSNLSNCERGSSIRL